MVMLLLCDVIDAIIIHQTEDLRIGLMPTCYCGSHQNRFLSDLCQPLLARGKPPGPDAVPCFQPEMGESAQRVSAQAETDKLGYMMNLNSVLHNKYRCVYNLH